MAETVRSGWQALRRNTKLSATPPSGQALPPEARSGLLLFLRRGMWGWARAMATAGARPPLPRRTATLSLPAAEESRTVIHIFAAMAMNAEHRGATL